MPVDYNEYPPNWKTEIRPAILERAGNKCEWCGLANDEYIIRGDDDNWIKLDETDVDYYIDQSGKRMVCEDLPAMYAWVNHWTVIVLTIAHIENPDPMDCRPENLAALCQRCHHLSHNTPQHRAWAKKKYDAKVGQLRMFESDGE